MSCGIGRRCGSDPALLWLWRRLAATAPFRPLAWEPPYAAGAALEKEKKTKNNNNNKKQQKGGGPITVTIIAKIIYLKYVRKSQLSKLIGDANQMCKSVLLI